MPARAPCLTDGQSRFRGHGWSYVIVDGMPIAYAPVAADGPAYSGKHTTTT